MSRQKLLYFIFLLLPILANCASTNSVRTKPRPENLNSLYHEAQRLFHARRYKESLPIFQEYILKSKKQAYRKERLFWVMSHVGTIYLRHLRDPNGAIRFFTEIKGDQRLEEAQEDAVESWIGAAKQWKKLNRFPRHTKNNNELFSLGMKFYKKGIAKNKYPADSAGNADFNIAATYLVPFIINGGEDQRLGRALIMMGEIRSHTAWEDKLYFEQNFYFEEAIRRFPHTPIAKEAFEKLENDVRFAYSGSGGDFTPVSWERVLKQYKKLSTIRKKKKEEELVLTFPIEARNRLQRDLDESVFER